MTTNEDEGTKTALDRFETKLSAKLDEAFAELYVKAYNAGVEDCIKTCEELNVTWTAKQLRKLKRSALR